MKTVALRTTLPRVSLTLMLIVIGLSRDVTGLGSNLTWSTTSRRSAGTVLASTDFSPPGRSSFSRMGCLGLSGAHSRCDGPFGGRGAVAPGYTPQPLMAVPKRKTSKARRDKRRAQHGITVPRVQVCPTCRQPKRPHHVCPNCKTYRGREVEPIRIQAP